MRLAWFAAPVALCGSSEFGIPSNRELPLSMYIRQFRSGIVEVKAADFVGVRVVALPAWARQDIRMFRTEGLDGCGKMPRLTIIQGRSKRSQLRGMAASSIANRPSFLRILLGGELRRLSPPPTSTGNHHGLRRWPEKAPMPSSETRRSPTTLFKRRSARPIGAAPFGQTVTRVAFSRRSSMHSQINRIGTPITISRARRTKETAIDTSGATPKTAPRPA